MFQECVGMSLTARARTQPTRLMRFLYLVIVSDEECILPCSHKEDFLIVLSLHHSVKRRKRGQEARHIVTLQKKAAGSSCWPLAAVLGRHFCQQAWTEAAASASQSHVSRASDCPGEVAQDFLFYGPNCV